MKKIINLFDEFNWVEASEYSAGTKKKVLRDDEKGKTILLKLPEGFYMASHSHLSAEQHFLIRGTYTSDGKVYHEGTYQNFAAHEDHGPFESEHGALILVVWDQY